MEAFGTQDIKYQLFKPTLKISNEVDIDDTIIKFSKIKLNTQKINEDYKFEIFYTHLFAKIFSIYNRIYEIYLEAKKTNKHSKQKILSNDISEKEKENNHINIEKEKKVNNKESMINTQNTNIYNLNSATSI